MEVLDLLGGVASASKVMPKALIAPHAGYVHSGRVAGAAFAKLRASAQTITRVVLIGPAHYVHVDGIAVPRVKNFETPFGRVLVDTEARSQIAPLEFVTQTDAPHAPEHALEVELPFLQMLIEWVRKMLDANAHVAQTVSSRGFSRLPHYFTILS
jgi:AmmeMemoRadiSam system protein B